ncbi:MAG: VWA domain-containing protein [Chitinophagales bacterium]|nr:VWA domain-containing protein [Chitinophagales bacterium]
MFRFENPHYLYLLLLLPVLVVLFVLAMRWRKGALQRLGSEHGWTHLLLGFSERALWWRLVCLLGCFAAAIVALSNPQLGTKMQNVEQSGIDIMIAVDVSRSMLAKDVQPNRLERAQQLVQRIIDTRANDRIGLIVFAGNAYLQMPLTNDYSAAKLLLKTLSPDMVATQGTAIADAIDLSLQIFEETEKQTNATPHQKALFILSDGEDHAQEIAAAAQAAQKANLLIFSLGIGTKQGATIPVYANGQYVGEKHDANGNTIMTQLNESALQEVAQITGGEYLRIEGKRNELADLNTRLNRIEKQSFASRSFSDYESYFQYPLLVALLFLLLYIFVPERRTV